MNRGLAAGVISSAVATLAPQVAALVLLTPTEFAKFSLVFVALGLAYSTQNSWVFDPWLRAGAADGTAPRSPLIWASVLLALVAVTIPAVVGYVDFTSGLLAVIGFCVSQIRVGVRLIDVALSRWRAAIASDTLFLLAFVPTLAIVWDSSDWTSLWIPLITGSFAACVPRLKVLARFALRPPMGWFLQRRRIIGALWAESAVLDIGFALPLLVLARIMEPAHFAVFRAASSALIPIRLVLHPLRAWIALHHPRDVVAGRFAFGVAAVGCCLGLPIAFGLQVIGESDLLERSVLPGLALYAWPVGAVGALQFVAGFYYLIARNHTPPRQLLSCRVLDSLAQILSLVTGFALAELGGVVTGYVCYSVASAAIWYGQARRTPARG